MQQQRLQPSLQIVRVPGIQRLLNGNGRGLRNHGVQLLQDLLLVHIGDLPVRQRHLAHIAVAHGHLGGDQLQIAGEQQEAVDGGGVFPNLGIDHVGIDIGQHGISLQKRVQLFIQLRRGSGHDLPDDVVGAGGHPERLEFAFLVEIIDDGPGIENITAAEAIAVIPLAQLPILVGNAVICRDLLDFLVGESKILAEALVQDRIDHQIVHPAEDALLCHPQDTGQEAIGQMRVILEAAGEEIAHKAHDIFVEALQMPLLDRRIVFVDDDDGGDPVVHMEHLGQDQQRVHHLGFGGLSGDDLLVICLVAVVAFRALGQLAVPLEFIGQQKADARQRIRPALQLGVLEGDENDRVFPLIAAILLPALPDLFVPEVYGGVLISLLEEGAQHIHAQRFAEAARARKQRHHRQLVNEVPDEQGFIHVIILRGSALIIGDADRERQQRPPVCVCFYTLIEGAFRIGRDQPAVLLQLCAVNSPRFAERGHAPIC